MVIKYTTKDVVKFIGNKKESEKISIGILRDKFTKSIDVVLEKGAQNKECMNNIFNFKFDDSKESNDENIEDLDLNGLFNFNGDMLNFKEGEEVDFSKMRIFTDSAKIDLNNLKPQLEKLSKEMKNLKNSFNIKDEDINLEGLNLDEIGKALENTEIKVWHGGDKNSQAVAISIKGKKTKKDTKVKENNKIENPVPGAKSDLD
jgi:acetolactate synthase small subunit